MIAGYLTIGDQILRNGKLETIVTFRRSGTLPGRPWGVVSGETLCRQEGHKAGCRHGYAYPADAIVFSRPA